MAGADKAPGLIEDRLNEMLDDIINPTISKYGTRADAREALTRYVLDLVETSFDIRYGRIENLIILQTASSVLRQLTQGEGYGVSVHERAALLRTIQEMTDRLTSMLGNM